MHQIALPYACDDGCNIRLASRACIAQGERFLLTRIRAEQPQCCYSLNNPRGISLVTSRKQRQTPLRNFETNVMSHAKRRELLTEVMTHLSTFARQRKAGCRIVRLGKQGGPRSSLCIVPCLFIAVRVFLQLRVSCASS